MLSMAPNDVGNAISDPQDGSDTTLPTLLTRSASGRLHTHLSEAKDSATHSLHRLHRFDILLHHVEPRAVARNIGAGVKDGTVDS